MTHVPLTDTVARTLLDRVRRKDLLAAGVLADRLDELSHPLAGRVRGAWDKYQRWVAYWSGAGYDGRRRRLTRWEKLARCHRWLWFQVRGLFGRRWRGLRTADFAPSRL